MSGWQDRFSALYRVLRTDVYKFGYATGFFGPGREPTDQQREALDEINASQGVPFFGALKSGQGVGKTTIEALSGLWRAFRSYLAPTYVTAPTMKQCKDAYIKEIRQALERGDPAVTRLFKCLTTKVTICGNKDWGVFCLAATRAENFQGYHHPHMSFIVDEASGVMPEIIETIFGTLSNDDRFFLACGNPNQRECDFFKFFHSMRKKFHMLKTFNAEESPIVNKENVQRLAEVYGRDSDVYRVRVLGEFPLQDPRCVMNSDDLEACAENDMVTASADPAILAQMPHEMLRRQFGMDFARYGSDQSILYRRSGLAVVESAAFSKTEPGVVVARAFEMQNRAGWGDDETGYVADADGMGQGVMETFYQGRKRVHEFHNNGSAYRSDIYYNAVSEAMFELAALVRARIVYLPNDPMLISELSTRQYTTARGVRGGGRIVVEGKEDYCRRTGLDSPDRGDACCMAFYPFAFGRAHIATREARGRTASNRRAS